MVDVEGQNRSLLVTWTDNTGTEIDGYQVFQDGMMIQDVASAQRRFTITNLDPFSNHSVAVLAYNRFNGRVQVGPQSDSVSATTLQDCMLMYTLCLYCWYYVYYVQSPVPQ